LANRNHGLEEARKVNGVVALPEKEIQSFLAFFDVDGVTMRLVLQDQLFQVYKNVPKYLIIN
jgi:hypothetical protein